MNLTIKMITLYFAFFKQDKKLPEQEKKNAVLGQEIKENKIHKIQK